MNLDNPITQYKLKNLLKTDNVRMLEFPILKIYKDKSEFIEIGMPGSGGFKPAAASG
jgi:hypothetical protein